MKSEIQFLAQAQHRDLYFNSNHYSLFQFIFVFAPLDFHKEEMTHLARRLKTKRIARIAAHCAHCHTAHCNCVHCCAPYSTNTKQVEYKFMINAIQGALQTVCFHIGNILLPHFFVQFKTVVLSEEMW